MPLQIKIEAWYISNISNIHDKSALGTEDTKDPRVYFRKMLQLHLLSKYIMKI